MLAQIRGITLHEPWATLVAIGLKKFETRSWATTYRGKLLIHAATRKADVNPFRGLYVYKGWEELSNQEKHGYTVCAEINKRIPPTFGCVVAIAELTNCLKMRSVGDGSPIDSGITIEEQTKIERATGDWKSGRYAWKLENIQMLEIPIPYKGKQGLWIPDGEFIKKLGVTA
jgi:hypothetical protein